jgi:hypothetical protein
MVYDMENIKAFCAARDAGEKVEVNEEMFYYFLEVLPPVHMHYNATLPDGQTVHATYGFAEGWERVTAFWGGKGEMEGKFFAQKTKEMNPYG